MYKKIAVIGLGLIGGSVAAACRSRNLAEQVVGYSLNDAEQALELGLVDRLAASAQEACVGADVIVFATPPSSIAGLVVQCIAGLASQGFATDVGSTKNQLIQTLENQAGLQKDHPTIDVLTMEKIASFVPAHPIAGGDESGPTAASSHLFEQAKVILTPLQSNEFQTVLEVSKFWRALGASTEEMSGTEHDRTYALVSHLPHWIAFALAHSLAKQSDSRLLKGRSGAGLRDTTRIAGSSPQLWADISMQNREHLLAALDVYQESLNSMRSALQRSDQNAIVELLKQAQDWKLSE
jgi:prephenate dehydrogenase